MKKLLFVFSIAALLAAGCSSTTTTAPFKPNPILPQNSVPGTTQSSPQANPVPPKISPNNHPPAVPFKNTFACGPTEHSCPCATGNYCLFRGAMCVNPASACPASQPAP